MARVAILVDEPDWHTRDLTRALVARGADVAAVSLAEVGFRTDTGQAPQLTGLGPMPDVAFVRVIATGSFEQVTKRLGALHGLRALGVPVTNDPRAIETCVDKSMTSFRLALAGIATPPTWTVESAASARALVTTEAGPGRPLVLKPLFGSQGRGLRLIETPADLPPADEVAGVHYLQRYVGATRDWHDWRVFVIGDRAIAAMRRHGTGWRTNAAQGAHCEAITPTGAIADLACAALAATGAGHGGVDIIRDRAGDLTVLEVNSMPAWRALRRASGIDVAAALAEHVLGLARAPAEGARSR